MNEDMNKKQQHPSLVFYEPGDTTFLNQALMYSEVLECAKGKEIDLNSLFRSFFYIEHGTVEVYYTVNDTKITVALLGSDQFFGEIGFFDGESRVREIKAVEDAAIHIFSLESMEKFQKENPLSYCKFLTFLSQSICAKFRRILEETEPLTGYAASLSTGGKGHRDSKPLPHDFLKSRKWHDINPFIEEFKARFFDIAYALQKNPEAEIPTQLQEKCDILLNEFNDTLTSIESQLINDKDAEMVWGYVFKEAFPYFMRSRFAERAYYKPKGYAGDFNMIEILYANQPDGDGKLGILIDSWLLRTPAARAIRSRRKLLKNKLAEFSKDFLNSGEPVHIVNLACGSNRELFDFLEECTYSDRINALCVDIDSEALQFTNQRVNTFPHKASIRLMTENLVKWALGRVQQNFGQHNIIYSSGLMDYLDDRLVMRFATRCHEHLKPGGKLILGNFAPANPNRTVMDHILQWRLIHRSPDEFKEIFHDSPFGNQVEIISEQMGINLFIVATKKK
ncbi:MAG: class I SAM-dependent methyltransferase family protein [Desulfobulbaceae bacterium]|nr:class I SAM-dependent methyltransferase family protein [Desulfobulbaceae bacterium]